MDRRLRGNTVRVRGNLPDSGLLLCSAVDTTPRFGAGHPRSAVG
uniref:Ig-like domain-containing protein n=1 Tax=Macrostomum lignano TaxID=282301 RepID=A0A1I8I040_9PLAT